MHVEPDFDAERLIASRCDPAPRPRLVAVDPEGPVLVEGPVSMRMPDGQTVTSQRFVVAVCTCRRSRAYPWCDTSHRRREKLSSSSDGGAREPERHADRAEDPTPSEESTQ